MKVNVTMFKTGPGSSKPMLDFTTIEVEDLWDGDDALEQAMKFFHVSGTYDSLEDPIHLCDVDESWMGIMKNVTGNDGAAYRFLLEQVFETERKI